MEPPFETNYFSFVNREIIILSPPTEISEIGGEGGVQGEIKLQLLYFTKKRIYHGFVPNNI